MKLAKKEQIGLRIKTMRLSRNMTQADLAKAINQSQSSITMYETGRREPDFETLETLADVFNVPLVSLMIDPDSELSEEEKKWDEYVKNQYEQPANDDVRLLIRGLNKLSPEQLEQATNMMKIMFAKYADYFDKENDHDA
ncbi:MAG: helix-turn-helix domain-containing protein [Clostridiales bacterium]|nr:helix-turn-helix domain-containing protein [Clostridiales bacterium]